MRTILITGASTGFGYKLARGLREAGERPIASMRDPAVKNAPAARELAAAGIDVVAIDVTRDDSVEDGVADTLQRTGRIDVLVNNAGYGLMGPMEAATVEDLKEQFETNLFGAHRMIRAVLPHMRARGDGLLIHLSSGAGRFALPAGGVYCASKWALEAMGECLRYELAPLGIDSTIVEPGPYATDFATRSLRFRRGADVPLRAGDARHPQPHGRDDARRSVRDRRCLATSDRHAAGATADAPRASPSP
jgi:NAD(P)-dependent dehydrogenase (short-subunit alcohol dehydrogenase family)